MFMATLATVDSGGASGIKLLGRHCVDRMGELQQGCICVLSYERRRACRCQFA